MSTNTLKMAACRRGNILVLLAILLPMLIGIVGLVIDGGLMMDEHRNLQHATDAAATAAALDLQLGKSAATATATATNLIQSSNGFSDATVTVHVPPTSGAFAGQSNHVEVIATRNYSTYFTKVVDSIANRSIQTRAVAGVRDATAGAAIVVLDPDPANLSLAGLSSWLNGISAASLTTSMLPQTGASAYLTPIAIVGPTVATLVNTSLTSLLPTMITSAVTSALADVSLGALPTLTAGFEVEGIGQLSVNGSIFVNTTWGGVDENGELSGSVLAPPYGVACMPILPTTKVLAKNVRVVGGVDNKSFYQAFANGGTNPLQANRLPVSDPLASLGVPSTASDATNVKTTVQSPSNAARVALSTAQANTLTSGVTGLLSALLKPLFSPLIAPLTTLLTQPTLQPGVYDSITVVSPLGGAVFSPGVYIIRNKSAVTNMSLLILGPVQAQGVMFYITDSSGYNAANGQPDAGDNSSAAPANPITALVPSALILSLTSGGHISGLSDASSPFNGMLIYQRRMDRRPIVIEAQHLLGGGDISGTIYSKWGHVLFVGGAGSYNLRFAAGTMRVLTVFQTTIAPTNLFSAAQDVFLLE